MSSRLFTEVREKRGLCYYVHSEADQFHDKGLLGAAAGVDPARIIEAIQVSVGVFHELAAGSKKLTKTELKRAQEYLVGKLVLNMEDSDFVAQFAGLRQILLNEVTTPQETIAKIQAVTLEQVTALAERLIQPGQLRLGLIGPYQDERTFAELIKDL
jgi:predicted Zn-dependent peptidase